jgi:hypothetical protein
VLKALYCSAPGVPVVGLLQAWRERKRDFQVPGVVAEDVVGELESKCVVGLVSRRTLLFVSCVLCVVLSPPPPRDKGVRPPFIDQGTSESHARRAILAT